LLWRKTAGAKGIFDLLLRKLRQQLTYPLYIFAGNVLNNVLHSGATNVVRKIENEDKGWTIMHDEINLLGFDSFDELRIKVVIYVSTD